MTIKSGTATVREVMRWRPCARYWKEEVERLFGLRKKVGVAGILAMPISMGDRLWAIGHLFTREECFEILEASGVGVSQETFIYAKRGAELYRMWRTHISYYRSKTLQGAVERQLLRHARLKAKGREK